MNAPRLEQHIRERIHHFDMPALLALLAQEGYGENDIEYRSHRTLVHQGHLVHDIHFTQAPRRRVILTVNIGLLSVQSPLPAFLLHTLEELDPLHSERMERFLGYFDHELLRTRFAGLYPEQSSALVPGWETTAQSRLGLLNLTSPSTIHWLFSHAFPEAEVSVRREVRAQPVATRGAQVSATAMGDSTAMGGYASVPTRGLEVAIFFNERHCDRGILWAIEAPHRLSQRVFPLLVQDPVPLTVWMVLRDPNGPARLQQDSHLGYTPLVDVENRPQQFLLFRGKPSHRGQLS
jgi:hypothetical protein